MENSSKALLIAAAVLTVILIITIGIKIFSSTSDTQKVATDTGTTIKDKTRTASDLAISEISGQSSQGGSNSGTSSQKIKDAITKNNYGDYIDLGQSVVGTSATTDDWRILYNDKNGHIYAILADYLPNNNAAVTASGLATSRTYNVYSSSNRQDLLDKLNSTTAWQSLIPEGLRSSCQVKGATTAEIIMASYNEKYGTSLVYTSNPYLYIDADSSKGVDTLYMPHPGSSDYNGCWGYWLASPRAVYPSRVWNVNFLGRVGSTAYSGTGIGVCPVVSLPSNIQVIQNGTVWTVVQ